MKRLVTAIRKLVLLCVSEMIGNSLGFWFIGLVNRVFLHRKLTTVFLYYSVNRAYMESMIFAWYAPRVRWRPGLAGVFVHGHGGGLCFGISADESHLLAARNVGKLRCLHQRLTLIAKQVGADHVAYAGIIPSRLHKLGIRDQHPERTTTVHIILHSN